MVNRLATNRSKRRMYRLDNAANLYPAIRNRKRPGVFRLSAELIEPINPISLQTALDRTIERFPGFSVKLRSGLFWHYFVHSEEKILIQKDVANPCTPMTRTSTGGFLMRVRYFQNWIAVEFFHAITDGSGAMIFLKTLIAQYLLLAGIEIPATHGVLKCDEIPPVEETQDVFTQFAGKSPTRKVIQSRAFHVKGTPVDPTMMKMIIGTMPVSTLKQAAGLHNVTITEYLSALFLKVLFDHQAQQKTSLKLPIKIQVPVNLRKFFPVQTLRNFSAYVIPSIDPAHGTYSFAEITELVHHFLRYEATKKHLQSQVAANVKYASHPLVRVLPLGIKKKLILLGYKIMGPSYFTSTLSNLGVITIPEEMEQHVRSFGFIIGATPETNISCAVLGYAGLIQVTFSRVIKETAIERRFFQFLVEQGVPVHIDTNQEDEDALLC